MAITRRALRELTNLANDGDRLVLIGANDVPKILWGGLGNRSGLHSAADTITREKWEKSGKGLVKKLLALEPGAVVEVHIFRNINRDRGNWSVARTETIEAGDAPACYHLESDSRGASCKACGYDMYETISPIL